MKNSTRSTADVLTLCAGIIAISALAWLFSERFIDLENGLSHSLFGSFLNSSGETTTLVGGNQNVGAWVKLCLAAGFSTVAVLASYKLARLAKVVILLQMLALNVVLHIIVAQFQMSLSMPISLFIASSAGIGFGHLLKVIRDSQQNIEARGYVIEDFQDELNQSKIQIIKDDETERRVLAGDLHDQVLNDLKLLREKTREAVKDGEAKQELDGLIVSSMQHIREVMDSLSPAVLQHLGFIDAAEDCVRRAAERASCKVRFRSNLEAKDFERLNQTEQSLLYRLIQESLTNICKHAEASIIKCVIAADGDTLTISISDNGKGIDKEKISSQSRGVNYMQQRASIIGASVNWRPGEDGKGTTVDISIKKPRT